MAQKLLPTCYDLEESDYELYAGAPPEVCRVCGQSVVPWYDPKYDADICFGCDFERGTGEAFDPCYCEGDQWTWKDDAGVMHTACAHCGDVLYSVRLTRAVKQLRLPLSVRRASAWIST